MARSSGLFAIACALFLALNSVRALEEGSRQQFVDGDSTQTAPWIEVLSWSPRAFLYHNFISDAEANHILDRAKPYLSRSTVVGPNGSSVLDQIRTSYGVFLNRYQTPTLGKIQERIAQWTQLDVSHQEDMQVLRYSSGQQYGAHYDSLVEDTPRVATVLIYLSDVEEGGETAFPHNSQWVDDDDGAVVGERMHQSLSSCADGHVAVKPKKGDALLFFSLHLDGTPDDASLHTGCPVLKGIKYTSTVWIHTAPFRPAYLHATFQEPLNPEECVDSEEECGRWAKEGECSRNLGYMVGDSSAVGACRLSCEACEGCRAEDRACRSRNRVRSGYLSLEELDAV